MFTVPDRLADGDPWAAIDDVAYSLEPLLALFEEQGAVELNYPPDYPKMPGEPPRVQPSRRSPGTGTQTATGSSRDRRPAGGAQTG